MRQIIIATLMLVFVSACCQNSNCLSTPPHLDKRGEATQLIVNGKPYLAMTCELKNSSSSSCEYMKNVWAGLKETGLKTVIASVSWEQVEPEEGKYDFSAIDGLVSYARANNIKLILIWFASWKNGITSYTPVWVKNDPVRFPLALTKDGRRLPILSTMGNESAKADAAAFAATMRHIREIDSESQTVIMMQIENEVGLHGYTKDYHPDAIKAFDSPVPDGLIDYLVKNRGSLSPQMESAWSAGGYRTAGTWKELFGDGDSADEFFMAWNYASYIEKVVAAGKAEYDIPAFVNAWIVQPEDVHPGNYPSGGPQSQNRDVWKAAAPHLDILCPDIYLDNYPEIIRMYFPNNGPVFVPESRSGQNGAANAAFTIGEMNGIGYSPFGLDKDFNTPGNDLYFNFCKIVENMKDVILKAQSEGRIRAVWLKGSNPVFVKDERTLGDYRVCFELKSSGMRNGGAPQLTGGSYDPDAIGYAIVIDEGEGNLLFLGSNVRVTFLPADGNGTIGLARVIEGKYNEDGEWQELRWLNGDEIQLRYDILKAIDEGFSGQGLNFGSTQAETVKVKLFRY